MQTRLGVDLCCSDSLVSQELQAILTKPINWEIIEQQYDELIKFATALRLGTYSSLRTTCHNARLCDTEALRSIVHGALCQTR